jgi:hypothetical protein
VVVSDEDSLHFFSPDPALPDLSGVTERDSEPVLQIYCEQEWAAPGDTITLDYNLKRPFIKVSRFRWAVTKPNGAKVGLREDGSEVTYGASGWIENLEETRYSKIGISSAPIEYTLSSRGTYKFSLEATCQDRVRDTIDATDLTDVFVAQAASSTALNSITLPASVGTVSYFAFDSYGQPWTISASNVATRLNFHYDTYLADFVNKIIYVREPFVSLDVEA